MVRRVQHHAQALYVSGKGGKNRVRKDSEKTLRNFVNVYLRYHPAVTPQDKRNMGLRVPDGARAPIEPPKTPPVFRITQLGPRTLDF